MKSILTTCIPAFLALGISLSAAPIGYVFHFNVDENMVGSDEPIQDSNWNLAYGASATDASTASNNGSGDGFIVSGLSEGGTGDPVVPLTEFRNNDRGFIFGSGAGDSSTGFAPGALFFWRTDLTTVNVLQGAKGSGTVQSDWATPDDPPALALDAVTLGDLIQLSILARPRNDALPYRFALRIGSDWYVHAEGFQVVGSGWHEYSLDVQNANLYPLPFNPGVNLDLDVTDNGLVTAASLDPDAPVTGYGIYVDTDSFAGTADSWARADVFYVEADAPVVDVPPVITGIGVSGNEVSVTFETVTGLSYTLRRGTDLSGNFPTTIDVPVSGDGSEKTITDSDYTTSGSDKVFYQVESQID